MFAYNINLIELNFMHMRQFWIILPAVGLQTQLAEAKIIFTK